MSHLNRQENTFGFNTHAQKILFAPQKAILNIYGHKRNYFRDHEKIDKTIFLKNNIKNISAKSTRSLQILVFQFLGKR